MNIPNIDSKIMARAFALALSVEHRKALFMGNEKYSPNNTTVVDVAKQYEQYLIGDAELPEVKEDLNLKVLDMWNKTNKSLEESERLVTKHFKDPIKLYETHSQQL